MKRCAWIDRLKDCHRAESLVTSQKCSTQHDVYNQQSMQSRDDSQITEHADMPLV